MIRPIYLHGRAGHLFGECFHLDVATPAEAMRALFTLRPALKDFVRRRFWRIIVGQPLDEYGIGENQLAMRIGSQPLHLVPARRPAGGGDGASVGKIIAGVVLIGAALAFAPLTGGLSAGLAASAFSFGGIGMTFGQLALLGASMVLIGVTGLMSQPPTATATPEQQARPEDRPSFLFNGVTNNSQQGGPVPVVVGRHLVGSTTISGGLAVEEIAV